MTYVAQESSGPALPPAGGRGTLARCPAPQTSNAEVGLDLLTWVNSDAIRGRRFTTARRGYSPEEVEAFKAEVVKLCQRLVAERDAAIAVVERAEASRRESELARVRAESALSHHVARGEALDTQCRALMARVEKVEGKVIPNGSSQTGIVHLLSAFAIRFPVRVPRSSPPQAS